MPDQDDKPKKRQKKETPPAKTPPTIELYVHIIKFSNTDLTSPGAVVIAKNGNHAIALLHQKKSSIQYNTQDVILVNIYAPSATIIGRSDIKTFDDQYSPSALQVYISHDHHLISDLKPGALVIAEDETKATEQLNKKLELHKCKTYDEHPFTFSKLSMKESNVIII